MKPYGLVHSLYSTMLSRKGRSISQQTLALRAEFAAMTNEELRRLAQAERGPQAEPARAFAFADAALHRVLGVQLYPVQLHAAALLTQGNFVEMKTGEGKTFAIVPAAVYSALRGQSVHVATANEYLAERDKEQLAGVYELLGLSCAVTKSGQSSAEKRAVYECDVVYGTHAEFGFDYLRDNLVLDPSERSGFGFGTVIVDEADAILIDEARTPLVIAGPGFEVPEYVYALARSVRGLEAGTHYVVHERDFNAAFTEDGYRALEAALVREQVISAGNDLYAGSNTHLLKRAHQALQAQVLYRRGRHYLLTPEGDVVLIDEATGRRQPGRRLQDGLHEAIEAKEGVRVNPPTQTQAEISYQSFFGRYRRLCGLSGTIVTSAEEISSVYGAETVAVPTHRPVIRKDLPDELYRTKNEKYRAIAKQAPEAARTGQPVLIGTASVSESEIISALLRQSGVDHTLLNARGAAAEAEVISQAGLPGRITVATDMAGRGTDIVLGAGDPQAREQALAAGGLFVIATERKLSRRTDDQLKGRSGRQGEPGASKFYTSLEDDLLRVFGRSHAAGMLSFDDAGKASGALIATLIAQAQAKVETARLDTRQNLLRFDSAVNDQRYAYYGLRETLFVTETLEQWLVDSAVWCALNVADELLPDDDALGAQLGEVKSALTALGFQKIPLYRWVAKDKLSLVEVRARLAEAAKTEVLERLAQPPWSDSVFRRRAILSRLDAAWSAHMTEMDELRAGINLRQMAQQNPTLAFIRDGRRLFEGFSSAIREEATGAVLARAKPLSAADERIVSALVSDRVSRNSRCPCGSGKRFKECHGRTTKADYARLNRLAYVRWRDSFSAQQSASGTTSAESH